MNRIAWLWRRPEVNPETGKALTIPLLNPYDVYGRCFHLAWLGFFVAFLSWFAFPPLMSDISKDLKLTPAQVSNSNIVGLCSTLIARFALGPCCDKFGPRWVMAGTLLVGAVPTAFVPLVTNIQGVYAIRFFIGLLGGTFVPCQFWTTVFFDKKIVGRANALAGGWGNAGGGVAFFSMPAVMNALERRGYSLSKSWKYSFDIVPLVVIIFIALLVMLFGQDCPEGKWSQRTRFVSTLEGEEEGRDPELTDFVNRKPGYDPGNSRNPTSLQMRPRNGQQLSIVSEDETSEKKNDVEKVHPSEVKTIYQHTPSDSIEPIAPIQSALAPFRSRLGPALSKLSQMGTHEEPVHVTDPHSTIENPTFWDTVKVAFSLPTMATALPYTTTFGGELAIESIVSALYAAHAAKRKEVWSTQLAGDWGSMLGLLNVVTRPLGGLISDILYSRWPVPQTKKYWMLTCGFLEGVFLLYIGLDKGISMPGLIVSMAFLSLFMEMGNGANFSLVPHINPHHTGIVAGTTGSFGNLGGVLFSLAFRFTVLANGKTDYQTAMWYLGVAIMGVNALCLFIPLGKDDAY